MELFVGGVDQDSGLAGRGRAACVRPVAGHGEDIVGSHAAGPHFFPVGAVDGQFLVRRSDHQFVGAVAVHVRGKGSNGQFAVGLLRVCLDLRQVQPLLVFVGGAGQELDLLGGLADLDLPGRQRSERVIKRPEQRRAAERHLGLIDPAHVLLKAVVAEDQRKVEVARLVKGLPHIPCTTVLSYDRHQAQARHRRGIGKTQRDLQVLRVGPRGPVASEHGLVLLIRQTGQRLPGRDIGGNLEPKALRRTLERGGADDRLEGRGRGGGRLRWRGVMGAIPACFQLRREPGQRARLRKASVGTTGMEGSPAVARLDLDGALADNLHLPLSRFAIQHHVGGLLAPEHLGHRSVGRLELQCRGAGQAHATGRHAIDLRVGLDGAQRDLSIGADQREVLPGGRSPLDQHGAGAARRAWNSSGLFSPDT